MAVSINGTTLTFNDSTTMTTAATGTVSSVATGNGLSGGTITTSGTLTVACPSFNSVGSYCYVTIRIDPSASVSSGSNYGAGNANLLVLAANSYGITNNLSGTWKWMGGNSSNSGTCQISPSAIACRVS